MLLGGVKESLNTDIPAAVEQLQLFTYSEEQHIAAFHLESTKGSLRPSAQGAANTGLQSCQFCRAASSTLSPGAKLTAGSDKKKSVLEYKQTVPWQASVLFTLWSTTLSQKGETVPRTVHIVSTSKAK